MDQKQVINSVNIHLTTKHSGKMQGLASLSTSSLKNDYCLKRALQGDYRVLRTNELIYCNLDYMHISALDTNYRVSRV